MMSEVSRFKAPKVNLYVLPYLFMMAYGQAAVILLRDVARERRIRVISLGSRLKWDHLNRALDKGTQKASSRQKRGKASRWFLVSKKKKVNGEGRGLRHIYTCIFYPSTAEILQITLVGCLFPFKAVLDSGKERSMINHFRRINTINFSFEERQGCPQLFHPTPSLPQGNRCVACGWNCQKSD